MCLKGDNEEMNLKGILKKMAACMTASVSVVMGGLTGSGILYPVTAYAETSVETDSVDGTIKVYGFSPDLKSLQVYNYNPEPILYNGRTYRTGALIAIIYVGDDGTASISGLPAGTYRVREYKTETGYSPNKTYYTIKITDDSDNELLPDIPSVDTCGNIRLYGADGISLNGMSFQLRNVGASSVVYDNEVINVGEVVGVFSAVMDELVIPKVPYGVYELIQTESVTGIHSDPAVYTINIINDGTVELMIMVSNHEHIWDGGYVSLEPTCTEQGEITYTCTVCGGERKETVNKLGHNYYTQEPTCQEDGYRMCTRCDEIMTIPKTGHVWDDGKLIESTSCGENAKRIYYCTYCGMEKVVVLPRVLGHSYISDLTKASPSQDGGIIKQCTKCDTIETDIVIPRIDRVELEYTEAGYTGSALKPSVKVYDIEGGEISRSYYSVNYYNNIKVGTGSVKVSFKGNYTGSLTEEFSILPKGTDILSLTALHHGFTVKWAMQSKETTGYELEYATDEDFTDAGILQTTRYTTLAKTVSGLKPDTKYYVRIRTYKGASRSQWSKVHTVVTK